MRQMTVISLLQSSNLSFMQVMCRSYTASQRKCQDAVYVNSMALPLAYRLVLLDPGLCENTNVKPTQAQIRKYRLFSY